MDKKQFRHFFRYKSLALIVLFCGAFHFFENLAHKATDGFSLHRIRFQKNNQLILASLIGEEAHDALRQPFHYLDCGNQCFVFASADDNYVLKFFKYSNPPISSFLTKIPLLNSFKPFRPHRLANVMRKKMRDFEAYQIAYQRLQQDTGIVAMQLQPTAEKLPVITLTDKLGIIHQVKLQRLPFVLQKKATPIYETLRLWIHSGNQQAALEGVNSLLQLIKKRASLKIDDDDIHFYSNFGFIEQKAVQIDPGHFTRTAEVPPLPSFDELIQWCHENAPFLASHIQQQLHL